MKKFLGIVMCLGMLMLAGSHYARAEGVQARSEVVQVDVSCAPAVALETVDVVVYAVIAEAPAPAAILPDTPIVSIGDPAVALSGLKSEENRPCLKFTNTGWGTYRYGGRAHKYRC
jgi:hypothetical protein